MPAAHTLTHPLSLAAASASAMDERLDRLTRLAGALFKVPVVMLSSGPEDRQAIQSSIGLSGSAALHSANLVQLAAANPDLYELAETAPDALAMGLHFFAACPITTPGGDCIGMLCIGGREPRQLGPLERDQLRDLAAMAHDELGRSALLGAPTSTPTPRSASSVGANAASTPGTKETLAQTEERLRLLTDHMPALISYLDRELHFTFANARYAEWLGQDPALMIGRTVLEVFGQKFYDHRKAAIDTCLAGTTTKIESTTNLHGALRFIDSTYIPHVREGKVIGMYVLSVDATAARLQEQQLLALANTDFMTGLSNRRQYELRLSEAVGRSGRSLKPMALMFLDVDHFKGINDTLGHAAGDRVLKEFARRLQTCVRHVDSVARLAGDEFSVILENVGNAGMASKVAAKIVAAMRAPFELDGVQVKVTTSIGIAWSATPCPVAMARLADIALYQSKQAGRNTYTLDSQCD